MLININGQNALEAIDPALFQWCGFLSCLSSEFCIANIYLYLRLLVRCVCAQGLTMSRTCSMKAKSVSVIGSMSLNKDGSKEEFRDMRDSFTDRGSFQERCVTPVRAWP